MYHQVALYARVSSDRQVEEGTIASQLASLHAYGEEHDYAIDADLIFVDDGFSGATLVRPGLDALRDRAMVGALYHILVLAPDRLLIIPRCSISPEFLNLLKRGHENASRGSLVNPPLASIGA